MLSIVEHCCEWLNIAEHLLEHSWWLLRIFWRIAEYMFSSSEFSRIWQSSAEFQGVLKDFAELCGVLQSSVKIHGVLQCSAELMVNNYLVMVSIAIEIFLWLKCAVHHLCFLDNEMHFQNSHKVSILRCIVMVKLHVLAFKIFFI